MTETVKDFILMIMIVVICFGICIGIDIRHHTNERLEILECNMRVLTRRLECVIETCDGRYDFVCEHWDDEREEK